MKAFTRSIAALLVLLLAATPARAQGIPVFDISNLGQLIKLVTEIRALYQLAQDEYETVQRIGKGMGGTVAGFRVPPFPTTHHQLDRYLYARPLLEGLNSGDPRGEKYIQVMRQVMRPGGLFERLPPEARRIMEATYATLEIYDATAVLGVHQAATSRGYGTQIAGLIAALMTDITNPASQFHETTAIADNLAVAGLVSSHQGQSAAMTLSSILEQLLAKNKRTRDAAAGHMNTVIAMMEDHGQMSATTVETATETLRNWSLP